MSCQFSNAEEEADVLKVVVAYEDLDCGQRGLGALHHWEATSPVPVRVRPELWRFSLFSIPDLREASIRSTEDADLIVLAPRADRDLDTSVKEWLNACAHAERRSICALVISLPSEERSSPRVQDLLSYGRTVAWAGGLEFMPAFAQPANAKC